MSQSPEQCPRQLLSQALDRARALLTSIRKQQAELRHPTGKLDPARLNEGFQALENAARAAQRTVDALESALSMTPELPDEELP